MVSSTSFVFAPGTGLLRYRSLNVICQLSREPNLRPDLVGRTRMIALRADIDCLPMTERTELEWRSVHDGRAHKCGHDGHTSILLGTAAVLARYRDKIPGNVRLLFQPAEEGVEGGGAKVMVAEGALESVDEIYGLHNWPAYPREELRVMAGPIMGQVHTFEITVRGKGGLGSQPHECRDPILAGAALIVALQTVVSRGLSAAGGAVVSVSFYGIRDFSRFDQRTPTAAFRLKDRSPREVEEGLSQRGVYVWSGNFHAIAVTERLGLEGSGGVVRAGIAHYNTQEEVDYCLACLREIAGS